MRFPPHDAISTPNTDMSRVSPVGVLHGRLLRRRSGLGVRSLVVTAGADGRPRVGRSSCPLRIRSGMSRRGGRAGLVVDRAAGWAPRAPGVVLAVAGALAVRDRVVTP